MRYLQQISTTSEVDTYVVGRTKGKYETELVLLPNNLIRREKRNDVDKDLILLVTKSGRFKGRYKRIPKERNIEFEQPSDVDIWARVDK